MGNWTFKNSSARIGGAIFASNSGIVEISNSSFSNLTAIENSSILYGYMAKIRIESSKFDNYRGSGIIADASTSLNILSSNFTNGGSYEKIDGSAIKLSNV